MREGRNDRGKDVGILESVTCRMKLNYYNVQPLGSTFVPCSMRFDIGISPANPSHSSLLGSRHLSHASDHCIDRIERACRDFGPSQQKSSSAHWPKAHKAAKASHVPDRSPSSLVRKETSPGIVSAVSYRYLSSKAQEGRFNISFDPNDVGKGEKRVLERAMRTSNCCRHSLPRKSREMARCSLNLIETRAVRRLPVWFAMLVWLHRNKFSTPHDSPLDILIHYPAPTQTEAAFKDRLRQVRQLKMPKLAFEGRSCNHRDSKQLKHAGELIYQFFCWAEVLAKSWW
jgi:hypothetical protein